MIHEASGVGTVYRRMLDLLVGWAMYVSNCAEGYPEERAMYEREAEAIFELYQELGTLSGPYGDLDQKAYNLLKSKLADLVLLGAMPNEAVVEQLK